jgi:L-asparagine transporter-like permease
MSDLTAEKWTELNEKLQGELAATEQRMKASAKTAGKLTLAATVCFVVAGVLVFLFSSQTYALLIAMPPALLFLICVMYVIRQRKLAELARDDMDRISRDIRQWKKKRPAA